MKIKILIEGYAKEINGEEFASSSTVLITNKEQKIIVDPGCNRPLLLSELKKEGLTVEDITHVIVTHTHLDHSLLCGIFPYAKVINDGEVFETDSCIKGHNKDILEGITMISTPGHDQFHMSLLLETKEQGKVVIAGDVFWWLDTEKRETKYKDLLNKKDIYVKNKKQLKLSRKKVLKSADYIIPGHGSPFYIKELLT